MIRASVRLCVCAVLLSCTDPRARPVPPIVTVHFAPSFKLLSPGLILGSLYLFDEDGLDSLRLTVRSADSSFTGDSLIFLPGDAETTRPINWTVPAGLAAGTLVTLIAKVTDFTGFLTADTVRLTVQ